MTAAAADPSRLTLVRGASGFLGGALALRLHRRGERLRLQVRRRERLAAELLGAPGVEVLEADASDPAAARRAVEGVDRVFEMVGATVPASPFASLGQEVDLSLRPLAALLDALGDAPEALLVFPSSGGAVYGRTPPQPVAEGAPLAPESPYAVAKALGEEMVRFHGRRRGAPWLVVRFANPYGRSGPAPVRQGVVDAFVQRLLAGRPVDVWGAGDQVRDFLLVDDALDALDALLAAGRRDETFNVGSGVGHSLQEVMTALEEVSGRRLDRRRRDDVYAGIPYNVLDTSALVAATGWRPRHDLRSGLAVAWRRATGAA